MTLQEFIQQKEADGYKNVRLLKITKTKVMVSMWREYQSYFTFVTIKPPVEQLTLF
jgi:hypothetical protein